MLDASVLHKGSSCTSQRCAPPNVGPPGKLLIADMRGGTMANYQLAEMFSGPGGIAAGARDATRDHRGTSRIGHAWAVDYHPDTTRTYAHNITGNDMSTVFTADVRDFDVRTPGKFNAFAFGFPCNDFSLVGEQRGLDGEFGPLYSYGVHAIALNSPDWFIAENVSGIRGANGGLAFGKILSPLQNPAAAVADDPAFLEKYSSHLSDLDAELEYDLVAHLYRFEEYGIPQRRHRVLLVGIRRDIAERLPRPFAVPAPTSRAKMKQMTAREALEFDPIPEWATNNDKIRHPQRVTDRISQIAPGKNAFNTEFDEASGLRLNVKGATLSNIYRRLHPDKPAYTVTGSGGGGTHMYHWEEPRALTNRERARLQTFADDYSFIGGRQSVRRQIGMAVPPQAAAMLFSALLDTLDGVEYEVDTDGPNIDAEALISAFRSGGDSTKALRAIPAPDLQASIPGID